MQLKPNTRLHIILAYSLCLVAGLLVQWAGVLDRFDSQLLDTGFSLERRWFAQPASNDVTIVGIDEAFLASAREPLALLHRPLGELFGALASAQPRVVMLDVVMPEKSFSFLAPIDEPGADYDSALAAGLLKLGAAAPLVVGEVWDQSRGRFRSIHPAFVAASGQWKGLSGQKSIGGEAPEDFRHVGSALVCPDADGIVRAYPGPACQPNGSNAPLAGQVAKILGRPVVAQGWIDYGFGDPFSYIPAASLIAWAKTGDARLAALKGRTVLVGAVLDFEDRLLLPVPLARWESGNTRLPGVVAQAQLVRSLMNRGLVMAAPAAWGVLGVVLAAALVLGRGLRFKLLLFGLSGAAVLLLAFFLLLNSVFLHTAPILATGALAMLLSGILAGWQYWSERQHLERTFGGYVSPQVLKGIIAGTVAHDRAGEKRVVCVLFSDIRDFTTLSERLPADTVVELLNRYFGCMTQIVHRHGGMVDKFIGDGLMALFGAPQVLPNAARSALEASHEMLIAMAELNRALERDGLPQLTIGIGLHAGDAVIGHIGSHERHEYTAIGDTVNIAARLADLPKTLGLPIVCSQSVVLAVGAPAFLVDSGVQQIKGRAAMRVFGWQPEAPDVL